MRASSLLRRTRARPRLTAYAAVALACLAGGLSVWLIRSAAPDAPAFLVFAPIVCGAAVFAGLGPGLAATGLGLLAVHLAAPAESGGAASMAFAAVGLFASLAGDWTYRNRSTEARASRVLAEREAHLRSIYDTAPDALIVINETGAVQSYSAAAERMFGWSASEVLGRNVKLRMPERYCAEHDVYIGRYLDTGERRIIGVGRIVVGERKDGSTFPMELAVGEVRSEHGRVFTGFVRDLTERQAAEARLQELQSELVHMSRLTARGEMASALAHELNQPLSAIANYVNGAARLLERAPGSDARAAAA